ncbi:MAG TPA: bacillithiol biosynthesis cysteine-adding enzyme BshC [Cyclobacteriaceae bacterium]|nr:bacillithiol biosynthesis cysteine-adding enzyme BshC [Cyclobacteriaceae bacterium]
MQVHRVALGETNAFSNFFTDYIEGKEQLKPFYGLFPEAGNFKEQIKEKSDFKNREVLVQSLLRQYGNLKISEQVKANISSLSNPNTFTITTGHQLNIFTGPLFFVYKVVAVINACKELKKLYPEYNFVPVFWMASEDHDYEEIKSMSLYGKKYSWETNQSGAVGRFNPKSIDKLFNEIPGDISIFKEAYTKNTTLAAASRQYVNALFANEGLVVIDGDDPALKSLFKDIIREDVLKQTPKKLVEEKNQQLTALGYHTQVFARDINFFYLDNSIRARIEQVGDDFVVVDTQIKFTRSEIEKLIETNPEKFSPNVILRPVYQEVILPNLAYVGGPAEMIYWLQLKGIFDHQKLPFPILLPRCFALVVEKQQFQKWEKTKLEVADLFKEKNYLFNHWVLKNTHHDLTLGKELKRLQEMMDDVRKRASNIDSTLGPLVGAEATKFSKGIEKVERKMLKAEKRLHQEKLKQIEAVKDALFPKGKLQERTDNFLNFYQKDPQFIAKMVQVLDPFDFSFNVVCDD